jgi:hypothetical protein
MNHALRILCLFLCTLSAAAAPPAPAWPELRQAVLALGTPAGTAELFQANPRLAEAHASESAFQDLVQKWRKQLMPLPSDPDDLDPTLVRVQVQENAEAAMVYLTFLDPAPGEPDLPEPDLGSQAPGEGGLLPRLHPEGAQRVPPRAGVLRDPSPPTLIRPGSPPWTSLASAIGMKTSNPSTR